MPLYEFRCATCGEFEVWRKMAEASLPMNCPACKAIATRIFSPPGIRLNRGNFSSSKSGSSEPVLAKRAETEPSSPRYQSLPGGRPWMINHTSERL